jgi:hypothetical protein
VEQNYYDPLNQIIDFQAILINQMLETMTGVESVFLIQ